MIGVRATLAALAAAATLSACAAANTPEACKLTKLGEVPIHVSNNLPLIDVAIDGKPARLLLDTGANVTAITEPTFQRLGLQHDYQSLAYLTGLGAQGSNWLTQKATIRLAGIDLAPQPLPVFTTALPYDGLLGLSTLAAYDLDIDIPGGVFALYAARNCPGGAPPFTPSTTVPEVGARANLLTIKVTLDETGLLPVIDTGANRTILEANRLGLTDASVRSDRIGRAATADPVGLAVFRHRFRRLLVGNDVIDRPSFLVGNLSRIGIDGLLGFDIWRSRRLWISSASRTVTIGPAATRSPAP